MSTLKTIAIQHLNGTSPNITFDSNSNATVVGSLTTSSNVILTSTLYNYSGSIVFTPCGATGRMGPSLSQARSTYTSQPFQSTWLNNSNLFWVEQGIQYWIVPKTGTYTINAMGAGLGVTYAGTGAQISASFALNEIGRAHV